ncbi:MAG: hypothetical protein WC644_01605 [Ignavibacteria bacterium]
MAYSVQKDQEQRDSVQRAADGVRKEQEQRDSVQRTAYRKLIKYAGKNSFYRD